MPPLLVLLQPILHPVYPYPWLIHVHSRSAEHQGKAVQPLTLSLSLSLSPSLDSQVSGSSLPNTSRSPSGVGVRPCRAIAAVGQPVTKLLQFSKDHAAAGTAPCIIFDPIATASIFVSREIIA